MKKLFLITIILSSFACADSIYMGLVTDHLVAGKFNENNHATLIQTDSGFTIGAMTNSYNRESVMFGHVQPNKPIALGFVLSTGYEPHDFYLEDYIDSLPLAPMPLVSVNLELNKHAALTVNVIGGIVINSGLTLSF